jgi:predicted GIY-YIG superfamily endonuclease
MTDITRAQEKRAEFEKRVMALRESGLSQHQIADALDVPRATIQSIIRRVASRDEALPKIFTLYRHYNAADELLYIGITIRGERRMREHADDKDWWKDVAYTKYDHSFADRASLEAAEAAAVIAENPVHNKKRFTKGRYPTDAERRAAWLKSHGIQVE